MKCILRHRGSSACLAHLRPERHRLHSSRSKSMTSWSPVEFKCPDVRIRGCETTIIDEHNAFWAHLKPGVGYEGLCDNELCLSYTQAQRCGTNPGHVVCSMGFGKHRPNEDYCYKQIVCPACKWAFLWRSFPIASGSRNVRPRSISASKAKQPTRYLFPRTET